MKLYFFIHFRQTVRTTVPVIVITVIDKPANRAFLFIPPLYPMPVLHFRIVSFVFEVRTILVIGEECYKFICYYVLVKLAYIIADTFFTMCHCPFFSLRNCKSLLYLYKDVLNHSYGCVDFDTHHYRTTDIRHT